MGAGGPASLLVAWLHEVGGGAWATSGERAGVSHTRRAQLRVPQFADESPLRQGEVPSGLGDVNVRPDCAGARRVGLLLRLHEDDAQLANAVDSVLKAPFGNLEAASAKPRRMLDD